MISTEWQTWIQKNEKNLKHPKNYDTHYELIFAEHVLPHLKDVQPSDVTAQFRFDDTYMGKDRFADFVIKNESKGYFLAIELDGRSKMIAKKGTNDEKYELFSDFLHRQNRLLCRIPTLLRFANKEFTDTSSKPFTPDYNKIPNVVAQIDARLAQQKTEHDRITKLHQTIDQLKADLQSQNNPNSTIKTYDEIKNIAYSKIKNAYEKNRAHTADLINNLNIRLKDAYKERDALAKEQDAWLDKYRHLQGRYSELEHKNALNRDALNKSQSALQKAQEALKLRPVQDETHAPDYKALYEESAHVCEDLERECNALQKQNASLKRAAAQNAQSVAGKENHGSILGLVLGCVVVFLGLALLLRIIF